MDKDPIEVIVLDEQKSTGSINMDAVFKAGGITTRASSARVSIKKADSSNKSIRACFGMMDSPGSQWIGAGDCAELSEFFKNLGEYLKSR